MIKIITSITLLILTINSENLAEISYFDDLSANRVGKLKYYIKKSKDQ